jgi:hypothetical protein
VTASTVQDVRDAWTSFELDLELETGEAIDARGPGVPVVTSLPRAA